VLKAAWTIARSMGRQMDVLLLFPILLAMLGPMEATVCSLNHMNRD
jgi:hypothetical protein